MITKKLLNTSASVVRLARLFGTMAEIWTGLQADCDLWLARSRLQVYPMALGGFP
jgi:plasmid maintenance system antidote protein VapI